MTSHLPDSNVALTPYSEQMNELDFSGLAIDMALSMTNHSYRTLLAKVELPKETQQIDRAVEEFAKRYHECNPDLADSAGLYSEGCFRMRLKEIRLKMTLYLA
ncbi:hypothetical protein BX666DRAFT_153073 [Dichotomocladium elegans]|nr:hypothetical protein BX666DRAFT_153073 [Dichotomocladium elegans]